MTTYKTGNPLGSPAVKDLYDNAENLDTAVNSTARTWVDRFGRTRLTFDGMSSAAGDASIAVEAAQSALGSADRASDAAARAEVAKDQAQDAADLAQASSSTIWRDTYADLAAAMVGKPANTPGVVTSDPDGTKNGYYLWNGSALEFTGLQPASAARVEELEEMIMPGEMNVMAHAFVDRFGFVIGTINADGSLALLGREIRPDGQYLDANGLVAGRTDALGVFIVDDLGFVIAGFDGQEAGGIQVMTPPAEIGRQVRTDYMGILGYGQSLSYGTLALPPISTTQPYQNRMISSGTKIRHGEVGYDASALVPLVEGTVGNAGESPVTAACNGLVRRAIQAGELASDWVFVGASPGRSGRAVEQLMPASISPAADGDFERMIAYVQDVQALAASQGKRYSVWAYCWDQGETNYLNQWTKSPYQYMQYQLQLFDRLTEDVVSITKQDFRPMLFTYQVGAHRRYELDFMSIALAQWRASRERPDIVLAAPVYMFPVGGDALHLTNEASWLLGEYRSRALYETLIRRGEKWRPLEPVSVKWATTHIDVRFHVPRGNLVLDTALCTMAVNFGFDVREAGTVAEIITSVEVVESDVVRISLARPAAADALLTYARGRNGDPASSGPVNGARGNLRDSHGDADTAVSPLGNAFQLHNACVMFEYSKQSGF